MTPTSKPQPSSSPLPDSNGAASAAHETKAAGPDQPNAPAGTSENAPPAWLLGDIRPRWRRPGTWLLLAVPVLAIGAWVVWQGGADARAAPRYLTEPVTRGDLALTVTANGTLQPTRQVNIGSELSGTVARVLVDVNDRVKKGQLLVELDTAKLQDQITQADAAMASAQASLKQAQATIQESRITLARLEEVARLSNGQVPAATELDSAKAALSRALAGEDTARASIAQAQATLSTNRINLAKASIRAPIDGVILSRNVEPGYAVAASLQAVTLLTLAEDLSQLTLSVNVDEADVGQVLAGQTARFTVSAWPGRRYPATLTRVAFGSTITDNVVTYTTQLKVDNPDLSLRPGMTATALIAATEHKNVLLVPNTALSFQPTGLSDRPGGASARAPSVMDKLMPRPPGGGSGAPKKAGHASGAQRQVWVLRDGGPLAVPVTVGLSNGRLTEVSGEGLAPGQPVIVAQQAAGAALPEGGNTHGSEAGGPQVGSAASAPAGGAAGGSIR